MKGIQPFAANLLSYIATILPNIVQIGQHLT